MKRSKVLLWLVMCHNEWCGGTEVWKVLKRKPTKPQKCPACGWLAKIGDGIKPIYEEEKR